MKTVVIFRVFFGMLFSIANPLYAQQHSHTLGKWKVIDVVDQPISRDKLTRKKNTTQESNLLGTEFLFSENQEFQVILPNDPPIDFMKLDSIKEKTWRLHNATIRIDSKNDTDIFSFMILRKYGKIYLQYKPSNMLVIEMVEEKGI